MERLCQSINAIYSIYLSHKETEALITNQFYSYSLKNAEQKRSNVSANVLGHQVLWLMHLTPALERLRQEDCYKFQASWHVAWDFVSLIKQTKKQELEISWEAGETMCLCLLSQRSCLNSQYPLTNICDSSFFWSLQALNTCTAQTYM